MANALADAGRIGFLLKGTYNNTTTYEMLDVVFYESTNSTYIAKKATTGNLPTDTEHWMLAVSSSDNFYVVQSVQSGSQYAVSSGAVYDELMNCLKGNGNGSNLTVEFTETSFTDIQSTLSLSTLIARIKRNIDDLKSVDIFSKSTTGVGDTTSFTITNGITLAENISRIKKYLSMLFNSVAWLVSKYESTTTASKDYAKGDYFVNGSSGLRMYKVTSPITTGQTFSTSTNCTATNVGNEIVSIKNNLTAEVDGADVPFRFGCTEDGKYGYVLTDEEGADTVVPFKTAGAFDTFLPPKHFIFTGGDNRTPSEGTDSGDGLTTSFNATSRYCGGAVIINVTDCGYKTIYETTGISVNTFIVIKKSGEFETYQSYSSVVLDDDSAFLICAKAGTSSSASLGYVKVYLRK